ncbi:heavy-metal-associated domain-containing protein [Anaerobacillus sp. CMMVII]|uniref:heavy-metal-associated domain-containing protein n=1 Tax=Anaerobacillus sp. CMMVII TaxID=2755588 RepID=UPI0021B812FB|nr:heavy-metal-associated domain-containing protein [Anaerobacillus sp. CMMVII]MCT8137073.1 heavy-metal-associated domain-containing protein [Anaerobacillus sp. CMMVII]
MKTVIFKMEPFSCPSCAAIIEKVLRKQLGVGEVKIQFFSNKINITFEEHKITVSKLEEVLTKLGYPVIGSKVRS